MATPPRGGGSGGGSGLVPAGAISLADVRSARIPMATVVAGAGSPAPAAVGSAFAGFGGASPFAAAVPAIPLASSAILGKQP
jgi:hypothetical protein